MKREQYVPYVILFCLISYPIGIVLNFILGLPQETFIQHIGSMLPIAMTIGLIKVWKYEKALSKDNNSSE